MFIDGKCVQADTETQLFLFFNNCNGSKAAERSKNDSRHNKTIHTLYITMHMQFYAFVQRRNPDSVNLVCFSLPTVITATLISAAMRDHSILATFSLIHLYKEGSLAIQQAGKTMSTKVTVLCKKCPLVRRGEYLHTDHDLQEP